MIVVTGAVGFISSALISMLQKEGYKDIVAVDAFGNATKNLNIRGKRLTEKVDRDKFMPWLDTNHKLVQFVIHLGARTDTTEFDYALLNKLNLHYTQDVWKKCVEYGLPLIYASSAATYGGGEFGYDDNHAIIPNLKPLNPYGESKNNFDIWALEQVSKPYYWIGLKFFNVYGPNEYHKGRMASVVFHAFNQIKETKAMKLFRSHNPDFTDGGQMRDFIYVVDVCKVIIWLMENRKPQNNGIYNLGTGKAETFLHLTQSVFEAMGEKENISFIDTPADIRDKYQYFTEANMDKLQSIGYEHGFTSLKDGVRKYVQDYLVGGLYM